MIVTTRYPAEANEGDVWTSEYYPNQEFIVKTIRHMTESTGEQWVDITFEGNQVPQGLRCAKHLPMGRFRRQHGI